MQVYTVATQCKICMQPLKEQLIPPRERKLPRMKKIITFAFFSFAPQIIMHSAQRQISPTREWKRSECEGMRVKRKIKVTHCNIISILRDGFGFELSWEWRLCEIAEIMDSCLGPERSGWTEGDQLLHQF